MDRTDNKLLKAVERAHLTERVGIKMLAYLDRLGRDGMILAIHHAPQGARVITTTADSGFFIGGLSKEETTWLFLYLGLVGSGDGGFDTPAYAPHLTPDDIAGMAVVA